MSLSQQMPVTDAVDVLESAIRCLPSGHDAVDAAATFRSTAPPGPGPGDR